MRATICNSWEQRLDEFSERDLVLGYVRREVCVLQEDIANLVNRGQSMLDIEYLKMA